MPEGWAELPAAAISPPASLEEPYEVISKERVTPEISELWLRPRGREPVEYVPGQYVLLEDRERRIAPRSYSIANAPRTDGLISLLVTRVPGGNTSTWIHERLHEGDEVSLSGPYGTFVADSTATGPALFLAAGSGLAPIRALLDAAVAARGSSRLTLIFSARSEAEVIDRERFATWESQHELFHFIRTLTRDTGPPPRGRVPGLLPQLYANLTDHDVFIAGAPGFVLACAAAAEALGAPRERVHTEVFFIEA